MNDLLFPPDSSRAFRVARVVALLLIGILLLAWLVGAVLWWQGIFVDPDRILSATFFDGWAVADIRAASAQLGVPAVGFSVYWFAQEVALLLGFGLMSLLLFLRKPDWFGTYLAVGFMFVGTVIGGAVLSMIGTNELGLQDVQGNSTVVFLASVLFLFPDGRFVPSWMKWVAPLLLIAAIAASVVVWIAGDVEMSVVGPILEVAPILLPLVSGLASQIYRYVTVSSAGERRQTRGVIFSFLCFVLVVLSIAVLAPNVLSQTEPPTSYDLIATVVLYVLASLVWLGLIVTITLSVLRYRLWDIDVIIRRTTSYAIVTGLLVLVYFGVVVVLQRVFTAVTGQSSTIAIVLSTLLIAALFLPLRRRVQAAIDRRFFRSKYDAQKTLEAFAATVRDETDLDALTTELVRVIEETMQPESVTVWLAPAEQTAEQTFLRARKAPQVFRIAGGLS